MTPSSPNSSDAGRSAQSRRRRQHPSHRKAYTKSVTSGYSSADSSSFSETSPSSRTPSMIMEDPHLSDVSSLNDEDFDQDQDDDYEIISSDALSSEQLIERDAPFSPGLSSSQYSLIESDDGAGIIARTAESSTASVAAPQQHASTCNIAPFLSESTNSVEALASSQFSLEGARHDEANDAGSRMTNDSSSEEASQPTAANTTDESQVSSLDLTPEASSFLQRGRLQGSTSEGNSLNGTADSPLASTAGDSQACSWMFPDPTSPIHSIERLKERQRAAALKTVASGTTTPTRSKTSENFPMGTIQHKSSGRSPLSGRSVDETPSRLTSRMSGGGTSPVMTMNPKMAGLTAENFIVRHRKPVQSLFKAGVKEGDCEALDLNSLPEFDWKRKTREWLRVPTTGNSIPGELDHTQEQGCKEGPEEPLQTPLPTSSTSNYHKELDRKSEGTSSHATPQLCKEAMIVGEGPNACSSGSFARIGGLVYNMGAAMSSFERVAWLLCMALALGGGFAYTLIAAKGLQSYLPGLLQSPSTCLFYGQCSDAYNASTTANANLSSSSTSSFWKEAAAVSKATTKHAISSAKQEESSSTRAWHTRLRMCPTCDIVVVNQMGKAVAPYTKAGKSLSVSPSQTQAPPKQTLIDDADFEEGWTSEKGTSGHSRDWTQEWPKYFAQSWDHARIGAKLLRHSAEQEWQYWARILNDLWVNDLEPLLKTLRKEAQDAWDITSEELARRAKQTWASARRAEKEGQRRAREFATAARIHQEHVFREAEKAWKAHYPAASKAAEDTWNYHYTYLKKSRPVKSAAGQARELFSKASKASKEFGPVWHQARREASRGAYRLQHTAKAKDSRRLASKKGIKDRIASARARTSFNVRKQTGWRMSCGGVSPKRKAGNDRR
ncbi:unnamed protein product [Sympodiomycopsis kandeliae]